MKPQWVVYKNKKALFGLLEIGSATVTGRSLIPLSKKLNPIWWFQNDSEQTVDEATWYLPSYPEWLRKVEWAIRNPFQNLRAFVIGVQDRNYTVIGRPPVTTIQRDDIGQLGWQWSLIKMTIPLPFVCYSGKKWVWYAGWQYNGFFGFKLNRHN